MVRVGLLVCVLALSALAQDPAPTFDRRLSVNAILREDIFAGFMAHDLERLALAEKNLAVLERERPAAKSTLLAWSAAITLTRAAHAPEAKGPFHGTSWPR
jgi:hypothetical protein